MDRTSRLLFLYSLLFIYLFTSPPICLLVVWFISAPRSLSYVQTAADCIDYVSQVLDLLDHAGSFAPQPGSLSAAAPAGGPANRSSSGGGGGGVNGSRSKSRSISSIKERNKSWPQLFGAITATINEERPRSESLSQPVFLFLFLLKKY